MENRLLSKVLDEKDITVLYRGNMNIDDFYTQGNTYQFLMNYTKQYGEVPEMETVVAECPDFAYTPDIHDHFNYMMKSLKNATAKRKSYELLMTEAGDKFQKLEGLEFVNWLAEKTSHIKDLCEAESGMGTNYATNGKERMKSYEDRKENRTFQYIPTPFPSLTTWLGGGFELGDYVLLMAYTNRGKSWIGTDIGVVAYNNGFGVLHYSPELSKAQQMDRNDTLNGHYNNTLMKRGELRNEEAYFNYLKIFNEKNEVPYLIKTMEDLNQGLTLDVIEADLIAHPDIKMVIIDGFNLMTHKGNAKGNRDAMSNTSRALRQLFGKYKVVGLVIHQTPTSAEKDNLGKDDSGLRIVKPPEIHQYSETVAVIQDACTALTFDANEGLGKIKLAKARTPNVGKEIELHCDFDNGYIQETSVYDYM